MTYKPLHEMDLVPDPLCLHSMEVETIVHIFLECSRVLI